jgi:hypothetical protein
MFASSILDKSQAPRKDDESGAWPRLEERRELTWDYEASV